MSEFPKILNPIETLYDDLKGKSRQEKINHLRMIFNAAAIHFTDTNLWVVELESGKCAVFIEKANILIGVPHKQYESEFFIDIDGVGELPLGEEVCICISSKNGEHYFFQSPSGNYLSTIEDCNREVAVHAFVTGYQVSNSLQSASSSRTLH